MWLRCTPLSGKRVLGPDYDPLRRRLRLRGVTTTLDSAYSLWSPLKRVGVRDSEFDCTSLSGFESTPKAGLRLAFLECLVTVLKQLVTPFEVGGKNIRQVLLCVVIEVAGAVFFQ